jgi:hypothetical protein
MGAKAESDCAELITEGRKKHIKQNKKKHDPAGAGYNGDPDATFIKLLKFRFAQRISRRSNHTRQGVDPFCTALMKVFHVSRHFNRIILQ